MKCSFIVPLLGLVILALSGCATTSEPGNNDPNQETLLRSEGEYKMVERTNDIWIEKLDGTESRQLTHTPEVSECCAMFVGKGKYVMYSETARGGFWQGVITKDNFIIPFDGDDTKRKKVSSDEYDSFFMDRFK